MAEAMNHVRHCQQMRSTYTNYFLALIATVVGAIAVLVGSGTAGTRLDLRTVIGFAGLVVWGAGLLTLWRSALWTAHVWHNIYIFRRLRAELPTRLRMRVYGDREGLQTNGEFGLNPFRAFRSSDAGIAIIGSVLGSLVWATASLKEAGVSWLLVGGVMLTPLMQWVVLASAHRKRHDDCCGSYPPVPKSSEAKPTAAERRRDAVQRVVVGLMAVGLASIWLWVLVELFAQLGRLSNK